MSVQKILATTIYTSANTTTSSCSALGKLLKFSAPVYLKNLSKRLNKITYIKQPAHWPKVGALQTPVSFLSMYLLVSFEVGAWSCWDRDV